MSSSHGFRIDLTAIDLFGNDAAEDEDAAVFDAYALRRPETAQFLDPARQMLIARAFKGEGKSALLRCVRTELLSQTTPPIVLEARGRQLSPSLSGVDTDAWARAWKAAILRLIASEIGARIGMAWSDDAMCLVEEAERGSYRQRNLVSALLARFKKKGAPVELTQPLVDSYEGIVKRWAGRNDAIWIFVDDVDENFANTPSYRAKIASFFNAARELMQLVPEIRLRLAVRPNTWTMLAFEYESLSKVDQYCVDLRWTEDDIKALLSARVRGYLSRSPNREALWLPPVHAHERLIGDVFESPVQWNRRERPVHVPLTTLSRRRPRWVIELSREAARNAAMHRRERIAFQDVKDCLEAFGKRRIGDTVAEFRAQCPEIQDLIDAFSRQSEEYSTAELVGLIERRILNSVSPRIEGISSRARGIDVAAFLFQIGFLSAKRVLSEDEYEHLTYSDHPSLLRSRTNVDDGVRWEIHPVFRQALQLRDATGRSLRGRPKDPRGR